MKKWIQIWKITRKDKPCDDENFFVRNKRKIKSPTQIVGIFNQDIGLDFRIEKSAMLMNEKKSSCLLWCFKMLSRKVSVHKHLNIFRRSWIIRRYHWSNIKHTSKGILEFWRYSPYSDTHSKTKYKIYLYSKSNVIQIFLPNWETITLPKIYSIDKDI